jgi:GR25 family glycosyltransferase involved in LPS biosynthesis
LKFNDYFPKPVLINLDTRQDRLEKFDAQAKELGIEYTRLPAITATDPILGCKLSHIAALTMYDSDVVFVFEDDSAFVEDFSSRLVTAMENLPDDWDMAYLGANLVDTYEVNHYWHKSRRCCSTHAYAVKKKALPVLLESAKNYEGHIDMAFSLVHPQLNVYLARPTLVYQSPGYSDLQGESVDYSHLYF